MDRKQRKVTYRRWLLTQVLVECRSTVLLAKLLSTTLMKVTPEELDADLETFISELPPNPGMQK
jgi:hypothetical protein